jgi:ubiquitin-large subunit ribosomal protein L40e
VVLRELGPGSMRIYIQTLKGELLPLYVDPADTIADVKQRVYQSENVPADQQRLFFRGAQLEDNRTVAHYGIRKGDKVALLLRMRGC